MSNTQNQWGFGLCKGRPLQQLNPVQTILFNMHQPGAHQSIVPILNALPFTRQTNSRCAQCPLFHLSYAKAQICATITHCGRSYQLLSCRACNTHPNTLFTSALPGYAVTPGYAVKVTRSGVAGFRFLNAVCLPSSATKLRPNLTNEVTHTCRLQHLESSHNAISSDVDHIKALGSNIEGWKHQMNDAGAQAAAVLALVQSDGSEIRYRLSCK